VSPVFHQRPAAMCLLVPVTLHNGLNESLEHLPICLTRHPRRLFGNRRSLRVFPGGGPERNPCQPRIRWICVSVSSIRLGKVPPAVVPPVFSK
jgi:hypothetical protein